MNSIVYPYIPAGKKIEYVPGDNPFMAEAKKEALKNSTDRNHPTGAVLVKDGKIIGRAANQSKVKNPALLRFHKEKFCIRKILKVKSGQKYWLCYGCASHKYHSECQVVGNAKKSDENPEEGDVYLWGHWWCCEPCWNEMIKGGIKNVYLLAKSEDLFNKDSSKNILGKQFDI